jgi:hypothetical protein
MSKLNLKIDLNELGTAQREALAAFITAPRKYDEQHDEAMQEIKEDHVLEVKAEQEEAQPTEAPKRTRAKRTTSTTSDALADKERTESIVDEYNSKKTEAVEPEAVEPEAVEPEAVEPEVVEPEAAGPEELEITVDELRGMITTKILDTHRVELKAKIVELGGTKLDTLPKEKYSEFKSYLKGLK